MQSEDSIECAQVTESFNQSIIQEISSEVLQDQAVYNMTDGVTRNVSGVIRQEVYKEELL